MNRLFVGMDVHKEKIVVVGIPMEGTVPLLREEFPGGGLSRIVKRLVRLGKTHQVCACYEAGPAATGWSGRFWRRGSTAASWRRR
jgi:hypothetical protein